MINLTFLMCALLAASGTELSGRVVDQQGQGVDGAIVVISTARPRVGPSTTCPSCYPDCTKRTLTDSDGRFAINGLSSKLLFSLAAGGSGYQGLISEHFDPAEKPSIELKLESLPDTPDVTSATGRVVDPGGNPIAGAEVRSQTIYRTSGVMGGRDKTVTPLTLTDSDGNFQITTGDHINAIDLRVIAAGFAPNEAQWQRAAGEELQIELGRGASIRGRLLLDDTPLAAVEVGMVQQNRSIGSICTPVEVSTDENGVFQFDQLPPDMDYTIYTHTGQGAKGVLPVNLIGAPGHGKRADLGDIPTNKPYRLTIVIRSEDGSPLPAKSTVYVGRGDAWRGTSRTLDQKPSATVRISDVSDEMFQISVRVPGYNVVRTTPPLNKDMNRRYPIRVARDVEVVFVIRKTGEAEPKKKAT
jgi:hypothetical protein